MAASVWAVDIGNIKLILKNCSAFIDYINKINCRQEANVTSIDIVMLMYNWLEYSVNYSKTSGSLLQYYRVKAALKNNGLVVSLNAANITDSFNFDVNTTDQTDDNSKKKKKKECWNNGTIKILK